MGKIDILQLATQCPGLTINIRVEDLVEANNRLIENARRELESSIVRKDGVTFLTKEAVEEKLSVSDTTLWRWKKSGYLVPVNVGGQRRYKSTDIDEIMEGKR